MDITYPHPIKYIYAFLMLLSTFIVVSCKDFNDGRTLYTSDISICFKKFDHRNYKLYLVNDLNPSELKNKKIETGNGIILTNNDEIYFMVDHRLLIDQNGDYIKSIISNRAEIRKTDLALEEYNEDEAYIRDQIIPFPLQSSIPNYLKVTCEQFGEERISLANESKKSLKIDANSKEMYFTFQSTVDNAEYEEILHITYKKTISLISPQCGLQQAYILEKATFSSPENKKNMFIGAPIIKNIGLQKDKSNPRNSSQDVNIEIYY